jgi:hypothetical protein
MQLAYSNIIDWVHGDATVSQQHALALLTQESRQRVLRLLTDYQDFKLSFGYSDEDFDGMHAADFTPRRWHPKALDYGAWIALAPSMDEAIQKAEDKMHQLFTLYNQEG